jgi:hypothetical protein
MVALVEVKTNLRENGPIVRSAVTATAKAIEDRGRKNIAGALRNGAKWAKNFIYKIEKSEGGYLISFYLKPGFLHGFERGMISVGKPFMFVPVPPLRVKARKFAGKLWEPRGTNVLIRDSDHRIMYVGIRQVTNKQRFFLRDIAFDEANKFIEHITAGVYGSVKE